jgi:hypothetical protein
MFPGVDTNRLHLFMGLAHPVYGPMNLAYYMAIMGPSIGYMWYTEWIKLFIDMTYAGDRTRSQPPPRT